MAGPETVLATTSAMCAGGRDGGKVVLCHSGESGTWLHLEHAKGLGGSGEGNNPEQLFAMGYAACFNSAVLAVSKKLQVDASKARVKCEIGIGKEGASFALTAKLSLSIPDLDESKVREVLEAAHEICPYSKATRNNVPVELAVM